MLYVYGLLFENQKLIRTHLGERARNTSFRIVSMYYNTILYVTFK